ncbi:MAG: DUF4872 domain-containing protein [Betaproteobacteria bacterium]|nr:DUF4872 domain-containing protein [Betaproteobacteria bacterium]
MFDGPVSCAPEALQKARFAKGAGSGLLYYATGGNRRRRIGRRSFRKALKKTTRIMLDAPLPIIGVRGIRRLANTVGGPATKDPARGQRCSARPGRPHPGRNRH